MRAGRSAGFGVLAAAMLSNDLSPEIARKPSKRKPSGKDRTKIKAARKQNRKRKK